MALAAKGANVGSVFIDVKANADNFRMGMERAKIEAQRAGTAMTGAMKKTEVAANSLHGSFANLHTMLAAIGGVAVAHEIINIADKFSVTPWLTILLLFVLARVFDQGARMRDDIAGTV